MKTKIYRAPTISSGIVAYQRQLYVAELIDDVTFWMNKELKDNFCAKNTATPEQVANAVWYDAVRDEGRYVRQELRLPF